jgi:hypothetical protein
MTVLSLMTSRETGRVNKLVLERTYVGLFKAVLPS